MKVFFKNNRGEFIEDTDPDEGLWMTDMDPGEDNYRILNPDFIRYPSEEKMVEVLKKSNAFFTVCENDITKFYYFDDGLLEIISIDDDTKYVKITSENVEIIYHYISQMDDYCVRFETLCKVKNKFIIVDYYLDSYEDIDSNNCSVIDDILNLPDIYTTKLLIDFLI